MLIPEPTTPLTRDVDQHPRYEIRLLIVDDSEDDALAVVNELKRGGYSTTFERVDTVDAMIAALKNGHWDVIVSEYIMPSFSGLAALNLFKASSLNLPFILVSGKIGEDKAVEAMKAGATDYVMKDKLSRLVPAIERELGEAKVQRERRKGTEALQRQEQRFRALIENASDAIAILDDKGTILYESPSVEKILERKPSQLEGMSFPDLIHPGDMQQAMSLFESLIENPGKPIDSQLRIKRKDGSWRTVEAKALNLLRDPGVKGIVINYRDITDRKGLEQQARERMKELQAFYSLAEINEREGITLDQLYQEFTNILPKSWLYPEIACARIAIGASEFRTKNFMDSAWKQSAPVKVNGAVVGRVEVGYLEERPEEGEGPFLKEERLLIDAIAERLGRVAERKQAEEALRKSEARYRLLAENVLDVIWVTDMNMRPTYLSPSITGLLGYS
ncbi:MAG: PAS domain S-box protein, partial [Chloroflexi bacterium]|nr:PAS domain S-box protein [Chloroflexota bacterium]